MQTLLRSYFIPALATLASLSAISLLAGCGSLSTATTATPVTQALHMTGSVHGGQQPVSSAKIYLYAVSDYTGGPSTSLLTGTGYATSLADGSFTISGDYTCPSGNTAVPTYLLALGGNPGMAAGTNNSAIALAAALGPCSALMASTFININELSTVAAVTALQQFITDDTHIGANTTNAQNGYSAVPSLTTAMLTVNNLYNLTSGVAMTAPVNGNGTSPYRKLNTLGNILANCINTTSSSSDNCQNLFNATKTASTTPTDTFGAMLLIARNPGSSVATLYGQSSGITPYQPTLPAAPNDYSLAISYTAGNLTNPGPLSLDNAGDVWIANCASCVTGSTGSDAIVGFSPTGSVLSNNANFTLNVHNPVGIALDAYNGIWVIENASASGTPGNQVTRLDYSMGCVEDTATYKCNSSVFPVALSGAPGGLALLESNFPADAYVTDSTNGKLARIQSTGTVLSTVATTGLSNPTGIIADGLRNLYLVGSSSTNLLQYSTTSSAFTTFPGVETSGTTGLGADGADHIWSANPGGSVSTVLGYTGAMTSGSGYAAGLKQAGNVSIDGAGTAWIADCRVNCGGSGNDNVVHLSAAGASLLASDGLQDATLATPSATAIDSSGNLWISNTKGSSITELVGVAAPVVLELEAAASLHALGTVNYLVNGGFENGGQVKGDSTANAIPGWTYSSSTGTTGASGVDNGSPLSYNQKLTFYNGSSYQVSESQTVTVANGNYLLSCYVAGDPNHTSRTASLTATSAGTAYSNVLANLNYSFQPYTVANIPVTNGSVTISLNDLDTSGGYVGWDSCSLTAQ
jgi:hypothetical protein